MLWSENNQELVSSHSYKDGTDNSIFVWKMNQLQLEPLVKLDGHNGRILHMTFSPNGETLGKSNLNILGKFLSIFIL